MESTPFQAFAAELKSRRAAAKMTQAQLAEACHVGNRFIADLEAARRVPSMITLMKLARALGITTGELLFTAEKLVETTAVEDIKRPDRRTTRGARNAWKKPKKTV